MLLGISDPGDISSEVPSTSEQRYGYSEVLRQLLTNGTLRPVAQQPLDSSTLPLAGTLLQTAGNQYLSFLPGYAVMHTRYLLMYPAHSFVPAFFVLHLISTLLSMVFFFASVI